MFGCIFSIIIFYSFSICFGSTMPPPSCDKVGYDITCQNIYNLDDLGEAFNSLRSSSIRNVEIKDSSFAYIPHNLFKTFSIVIIELTNVSLTSLSDTDTAFEGLENSLERLSIRWSNLLLDIDWNQLRKLTALKSIYVTGTVLNIDTNINAISAMKLARLSLNTIDFSYFSDEAFASFTDLLHLELYSCKISMLKRSMLPEPGNILEVLFLAVNKITFLPSDIFTSFPNLKELYLYNNRLRTMDEAIFAPIWKNLEMLYIYGNPLRCDCNMKWVIGNLPTIFDGKCSEPPKLKEKELQKLDKFDIWCS